MQSLVKIKPLRNGKITLLFIDIGKSCLSHEFFTSLICLLMLFAKIDFSRKFPNLQYILTILNSFILFLYYYVPLLKVIPGRVAQSVTCLATDASLTADPGVASSIPARSHTFVEIDHEIISTVILSFSFLRLSHSRGVVVSYKRKYVHEVLVNYLFKLAQEKVWLGELTVPQ